MEFAVFAIAIQSQKQPVIPFPLLGGNTPYAAGMRLAE
jgi:hypothetical protein